MTLKTIENIDVSGKVVLLRCDLNIPIDEDGEILDISRIERIIPTVSYLSSKGAKIGLLSHFGRPNGKYDENTYGTLKIKDKVVEVNADISYNEGMENFTIAHEIGHIELHATNLKNSNSPECDLTALNNDIQIEKEADIFAACILMPEDLVKEAFYQIRKSPLFLKDGFLLRLIGKKNKTKRALNFASMVIAQGNFNVSKYAMINRLITLRLIKGVGYQKNRLNHESKPDMN